MVGDKSRRELLRNGTFAVAALTGVPTNATAQNAEVERLNPGPEVSVVPETLVLFEVAVRNYSKRDYRKRLYVDGEQRGAEPDVLYGQLDRGDRDVVTARFDSEGTHRVRLDFHDDNDERFETLRWQVRVEGGANSPPSAERVTPQAKVIEIPPDENRPREFALRATDSEGGLDRVVWWINQCDDVVGVSSVSGSSDTARVRFDPYGGCPLRPLLVDEDGAAAWYDGWIIQRNDRAGNYVRIVSDGGGVANYEFTATGSVRQIDSGDEVSANSASGRVGPKRGEDLFYFQGDLAELNVDGPATVWVNGERVDPDSYPGGGGGGGNLPHTLVVESEGGGVANYEFTVSGSIRQQDSGDTVSGNTASGHVGPQRGKDTFAFSGDLQQLNVDGPASVYVDGEKVYPDDGAGNQNTLEIVSEGGGVANYEFTVSGSVRQQDSGDQVNGNRVSGHVGPQRGRDTFVYTGGVTSFRLSGPATVYRNGQQVDPDALG